MKSLTTEKKKQAQTKKKIYLLSPNWVSLLYNYPGKFQIQKSEELDNK